MAQKNMQIYIIDVKFYGPAVLKNLKNDRKPENR